MWPARVVAEGRRRRKQALLRYNGGVARVVLLSGALTLGVSCGFDYSVVPAVDGEDTGSSSSGDSVRGGLGTGGDPAGDCGSFTLDVIQWTIDPLGGGDYQVHTLLEVEGPRDCYIFPGSHEHNWLTLIWSDRAEHEIYRIHDGEDHAGFGPRECGGGFCEIGDIFETSAVYDDHAHQDELDDLVATYGPPDEACGTVANADLIVREYCAPLE
ncbi:MAG: hypothetical protein JRI25_22885 [Deltaproteobacteria bacterium]|nr:hypothetical protein [Deltaproteobacteria bacterium]MBW2257423.1 hypothetical protein [Deltaproteobacteria bacterium]